MTCQRNVAQAVMFVLPSVKIRVSVSNTHTLELLRQGPPLPVFPGVPLRVAVMLHVRRKDLREVLRDPGAATVSEPQVPARRQTEGKGASLSLRSLCPWALSRSLYVTRSEGSLWEPVLPWGRGGPLGK